MTSALKAQQTLEVDDDYVQDPFALAPSADYPRESGIPPRRSFVDERSFAAEADDRVQLAIAESVHAEANLNLLVRGLQNLTAGAAAVGEANAALSRELDAARELLAHSHAEQMALKRRVRMLEDALECARGDADRERAFFLEQEDAFLAELLTEHARELDELRRRLSSAPSGPRPQLGPASLAPSSLKRTEEGARGAVLGSVNLRAVPVPLAATPAEADANAVAVEGPRSATRSRPPPKQKPDAVTRPLIEYSLAGGEVAEERVQPPRPSSHPPSQPPDTLREPPSQAILSSLTNREKQL